jgi:hypothetical protein
LYIKYKQKMGFTEVIKFEVDKFKRRGITCLLLGYAQALAFLYFAHHAGKIVWPKILSLHENKTLLWYCSL